MGHWATPTFCSPRTAYDLKGWEIIVQKDPIERRKPYKRPPKSRRLARILTWLSLAARDRPKEPEMRLWRRVILQAISDALEDRGASRWLDTPEAWGLMRYAGMGRPTEQMSILWKACDGKPEIIKPIRGFISYLETNLNQVGR